ncbi:MAG: glycoside hydrolase TIM-barrel-like domain-containing protein [Acidobacteriota bacterium]|nr:glycoside hydrolase TIM-barrel-like domain-containing protein [Acidobacteriota bacterium]
MPSPPVSDDAKHRGVSWVAGDEVTQADLEELAEHSVDWIVQTPFGWQKRIDSPEIRLATEGRVFWGERDIGLETTTRLARKQGIRTLLKPHIWLSGGKWRGDIEMKSDQDWQTWFSSYRRFILHYAQLAEGLNIEALAIGTELHKTVTKRPEEWKRLISEIRRVYKGKLTYAANWYREFEDVPFWASLDYIGIQAYFPLSDQMHPTVEALRVGWQRHLPAIRAVQRKSGRPVLFTEVGYRSAPDAAIDPWTWPDRIARGEADLVDFETQANAYRAFFETFWDQPWFAGSYIWKWYPGRSPRGARQNIDFTPQGKPALAVLGRWYGKPASVLSAD